MIKMNRRTWLRVLQVLLAVYGVTGVVLWHLQEQLLFHPTPLSADYTFTFSLPHKEVSIRLNETDRLHLVQFFPPDSMPRRGIVLYFHGNRENVNRYASFVPSFTKEGYEVWMPDYPGYGKTTGLRTERRMYQDAALVYKMAAKQVGSSSIIIYGKSLGTGVATELASRVNCKRLLLETPYYSIPELAFHHFPIFPTERMSKYEFPNYVHLPNVKAPVVIFQGTRDRLIPHRHAVRLVPLLRQNDLFITIPGGQHNNLSAFALYRRQLQMALR